MQRNALSEPPQTNQRSDTLSVRQQDSDELWLSQIYGQHSIYRQEQPGAATSTEETPEKAPTASTPGGDVFTAKELVGA